MNCSFSIEHYKECISLAKDKGYSIIPVKDYDKQDKKVILLRHDIDWSLENAYELANIEYDLGICSSYYVYLHSELYNALSPKSMEMIKQIKRMGHEIGLHYDSRYSLTGEYDILQSIIVIPAIQSLTQHNPSMTENPSLDYKVSLVKNANSIPIKYISDSGHNWREGCMCKHIGKEDKLHILVHPEWWVSNSTSREDGIHKLWQSNLYTLVRNMTEIKQGLVDYVRDDLKLKQY